MKYYIVIVMFMLLSISAKGGGTAVVTLSDLVEEALRNNPEMKAAVYATHSTQSRVSQAGALMDPELTYMREQMPGFRWNEAMMQKIELMQMVPFPTKLANRREAAVVQTGRADKRAAEIVNSVIARLKTAYFELWFSQQAIELNRKNTGLLKQFAEAARTKYSVGLVSQQDVLRAYVEIAKLDNQLASLRQQELSAKSVLMAILDRAPQDTLGMAVASEHVQFLPSLDSLLHVAVAHRPALAHDSLMVEESRTMLSLSKQEYLPDLILGIAYVSEPRGTFTGWNMSVGISLPFAPWTLGKANARLEEAEASLNASAAGYLATRNMVRSEVQDMYYKVEASKIQLENYRTLVVPQAEQSVQASMVAYQTGAADFLSLIDAYRTLVDLREEALMRRLEFEQGLAELERVVGTRDTLMANR